MKGITATLVIALSSAWLSASDLTIDNDTQSIRVVGSTVKTQGDAKQVEIQLRNLSNSPLLGISFLKNKDLNLATSGYGTAEVYAEQFLRKDRIAPGQDFKSFVSGDLKMVQITVACAVFKSGDEGDALLAERLRADFEGMAVRAKQLLALLQSPGTGPLTNEVVLKLEATVKALPDTAPSKKLSARSREAFLYGQRTQKEAALQTIAELKEEMKRHWNETAGLPDSDRYFKKQDGFESLRKYHAEMAEVLQ